MTDSKQTRYTPKQRREWLTRLQLSGMSLKDFSDKNPDGPSHQTLYKWRAKSKVQTPQQKAPKAPAGIPCTFKLGDTTITVSVRREDFLRLIGLANG